MNKQCSKCSESKPVEEFSPLRKGAGGLGSWCKCCKKIYAQEHYLKNKKKYQDKSLKWQKENPLKVKEIKKKYNGNKS